MFLKWLFGWSWINKPPKYGVGQSLMCVWWVCLCVCPTLFRLTEFHVRQGKIKPIQSAESPGLTAFWNPGQICPSFHSKCQNLGRKQKGKVQAGSETAILAREIEADFQELDLVCPRQWEMGTAKGRKKCWLPFGRNKGPAEGWVWKNCSFGPWWWLLDLKDFFPFQEVIDAGQSCQKKRIVPVAEALLCQEGAVRERAAPGTKCPRKETDEVLVIRHWPCSWAIQRISVTGYEFHMFWGWNALWLCSIQEAAPGIDNWESCMDRKQISGKKGAGRRCWWDNVMKIPASHLVGELWVSVTHAGVWSDKKFGHCSCTVQKSLPELVREGGSTVKIAGADRKEKKARRDAKMPSASWL